MTTLITIKVVRAGVAYNTGIHTKLTTGARARIWGIECAACLKQVSLWVGVDHPPKIDDIYPTGWDRFFVPAAGMYLCFCEDCKKYSQHLIRGIEVEKEQSNGNDH